MDLFQGLMRKNLNDAFKLVATTVDHYESQANHLIEENRKLKSEHYKDTELARMECEIAELRAKMNQTFNISNDEMNAIRRWKEEHIELAHHGDDYSGAIGGRWTYCFTPTGIGEVGVIKCTCGAEFTFRELE